MAEENKIVDRIKAEGQLTRNSGTNSMKSIRVDLDKLGGVFESIEKNIAMQSSFIESIYNLQVDRYEMERERDRDLARLERLRNINDETETETDTTNEDDSSDDKSKDDKKTESIISRLFSGRTGIIALAAVASPFIYQFARGFIDELTGGKFTAAEEWLAESWPTIVDQASAGFEWARSQFNWIKDTIQLAYNNINTFLTTGNIEDLFRDSEGNLTVDIQQLQNNAETFASGAMGYLLFGPLGAIKAAAASEIFNAVEELTGFELSPGAQIALSTLVGGVPIGGAGRVAGRVTMGLIRMAMRAVALNPVLAIAAAGAAAVYWMGSRLRDTINEYNATQVEADRILQDAEDRLQIERTAGEIEAETGAPVAETTNEGLTSVTNSEQLARVVAGLLPMVDVLNEAGEVTGQRRMQFNELNEQEQQAILDQAVVNLTPWINDTFERLVNNQAFYSNLAGSLIDNQGDTDLSMRQLEFFMDRARIEAESGNMAAATAYNTVLSGIQNILEGASLADVEEFSAEGFADYLRELGFQEGFQDTQIPMIDFQEIQDRLSNSRLVPPTAGPDDGLRGPGSVLLNNGGNTIRQGDQISSNTVTIIAPKDSASSLSNSGVMTAFG